MEIKEKRWKPIKNDEKWRNINAKRTTMKIDEKTIEMDEKGMEND